MSSFWKAFLIAAVGASVANLIVLTILRPMVVDPAMPLGSLAIAPVVTLTVIGTIAAAVVYAVVRKLSSNPRKTFIWISIVALVVSLIPDYAIKGMTTGHFAGATMGAVLTLMLMHVVAALIVVWAFLRYWK